MEWVIPFCVDQVVRLANGMESGSVVITQIAQIVPSSHSHEEFPSESTNPTPCSY